MGFMPVSMQSTVLLSSSSLMSCAFRAYVNQLPERVTAGTVQYY